MSLVYINTAPAEEGKGTTIFVPHEQAFIKDSAYLPLFIGMVFTQDDPTKMDHFLVFQETVTNQETQEQSNLFSISQLQAAELTVETVTPLADPEKVVHGELNGVEGVYFEVNDLISTTLRDTFGSVMIDGILGEGASKDERVASPKPFQSYTVNLPEGQAFERILVDTLYAAVKPGNNPEAEDQLGKLSNGQFHPVSSIIIDITQFTERDHDLLRGTFRQWYLTAKQSFIFNLPVNEHGVSVSGTSAFGGQNNDLVMEVFNHGTQEAVLYDVKFDEQAVPYFVKK